MTEIYRIFNVISVLLICQKKIKRKRKKEKKENPFPQSELRFARKTLNYFQFSFFFFPHIRTYYFPSALTAISIHVN